MGCFVDEDGNRLEPEDYPELYFGSSALIPYEPYTQTFDPDSDMERAARIAEETGDFSLLEEIFGFGD